ncbi:MAG: crossover junction endodeoxyribonuclease RuvC [Hyphomicrobiales bacterium]
MNKTTRIIGIDPGLRFMGWGIIDFDGVRLSYVTGGTLKSNAKESLAERLASLYKGLHEVIELHEPQEAAVEQTFVNKDAVATLKLGQARGIALLVPALHGCPVAEYAPNMVKKTVTGSGHADKDQIHAMLRHLLPKAKPETDDAADALAIAICHAHNRGQDRLRSALKAS